MQKLWIYSAQPIGGRKKGAFGGSFSFRRKTKLPCNPIYFAGRKSLYGFPLYFQFGSVFYIFFFPQNFKNYENSKVANSLLLIFFHNKNTLISHSVVTSSHLILWGFFPFLVTFLESWINTCYFYIFFYVSRIKIK